MSMIQTNLKITLTRQQIKYSKLYEIAKKEQKVRLKRRITAIAMIAEGKLSREEIARQLKTDSDRIRVWLTRYNEQGLDGMKEKSGRGRKPTMTQRQETAFKRALKRSPRASGVSTNFWTGRAAKELLEQRGWFYGNLSGVYAIIHRLGFTLQTPAKQSLETDPVKERQFLIQLKRKKKEVSKSSIPGRR